MFHDPVLTYLAGFVDGDGSIQVSRYNKSKKMQPAYRVMMTASQLEEHREPLDLLHKLFGGTIRKMSPKNRGIRPLLQWEVTGRRAGIAVKTLFPYFQVKSKPAGLALIFHCLKELKREERGFDRTLSHDEILIGQALSKACSFFNGKNRSTELAVV